VGIDLAKSVFSLHGVDAIERPSKRAKPACEGASRMAC